MVKNSEFVKEKSNSSFDNSSFIKLYSTGKTFDNSEEINAKVKFKFDSVTKCIKTYSPARATVRASTRTLMAGGCD